MSEPDTTTTPEPKAPTLDTDDEFEFKHQGPIRRNAGLLIAVAVVVIVGPTLSRVLDTYRAIVLEERDGDMFVAQHELPPMWISAIEVEPGHMIEKIAGNWNPQPAEANPTDKKLFEMYTRWIDSYDGVIVEIIPPLVFRGPSRAIIETDDGRRINQVIWAKHLAEAQVDRRVSKRPNAWDPILVPVEAVAPSPLPAPSPGGGTPD